MYFANKIAKTAKIVLT